MPLGVLLLPLLSALSYAASIILVRKAGADGDPAVIALQMNAGQLCR
jgi:drug/metabolite transporter (DMT)-like permease